MKPTPILILSDSVDAHSGLARISRDICAVISRMPEFRVASLGRGGRGSSKLPWTQYVMGQEDWGESYIEECWRDFAGSDMGILFSIYDPVRLRYLVDGAGQSAALNKFLRSNPFAKWIYAPIDAAGPNNLLTGFLTDTIGRFQRIAAYTLWAQDLLTRSTERPDITWVPHGVNFKTFQPRGKTAGRLTLGLKQTDTVIGTVMTNQTRKDWSTAAMTVKMLREHVQDLRWWIHIDQPVRHWNINALIEDLGLGDIVRMTITRTMNDEEMSYLYSCCDLTILPSSEGFGYPIVESLACGVPVIHSTYAGGAELVPNPEWKVQPISYRLESPLNCLRPVFDPADWVEAIRAALDHPWTAEQCRESVEHLSWDKLGAVWRKWLLDGLEETRENKNKAQDKAQEAHL